MVIRKDPTRDRGPGGHAAKHYDEVHRERSDKEIWEEALLVCERAAAIIVGYSEMGLPSRPEKRSGELVVLLDDAYLQYEEKPNEIEIAESQLSIDEGQDSGGGEVRKSDS